MFYGAGAGAMPTATSVVADLVAVIKNLKLGVNGLKQKYLTNRKSLRVMKLFFIKTFCFCMLMIKQGYWLRLLKCLPNMM